MTMSWFTRSTSDGLAKAMNTSLRSQVSSNAEDLAVFGLLPLRPIRRSSSLFCRDVAIEPKGHEDPWESIHLILM